MDLFLLFAIILFSTYILGNIIEKVRIPWVFSALVLGLFLSLFHVQFEKDITNVLQFFSDAGMYFLLFIIGLNLDFNEVKKQGRSIMQLSLTLVFTESLVGALFIYFVFHTEVWIAILVASSFATIGEAILIPILEEFKIIKTSFGQKLLSVGVLDDIVELIVVIITSFILSYSLLPSMFSGVYILFLFLFLVFTLFLMKSYLHKLPKFKFNKVSMAFLFSLIILFSFVGFGNYVEAGALGAILAGVIIKNILINNIIEEVTTVVNAIAYSFFVPVFFLFVGLNLDIKYLLTAPLIIVAVLLITTITKILTSYFITKNEFGIKGSVLLGVGLSAKFSTSIVVLTMLVNGNIIQPDLYSVLIGAMIVSEFIIPVAFASLINNTKIKFKKI